MNRLLAQQQKSVFSQLFEPQFPRSLYTHRRCVVSGGARIEKEEEEERRPNVIVSRVARSDDGAAVR